MGATTELEQRYTLLCDSLQLKNEELRVLQLHIQKRENEDIKNKDNKETEEKEETEETEEAKSEEIKILIYERTNNLTVRTVITGEVVEEAPNLSSNATQNSPNTPQTDLNTDLNSRNLPSNSSKSLALSPRAPLNPFAEDTIRKLRETIALKDQEIAEVNRRVQVMEKRHRDEEEAHGDSHDGFEVLTFVPPCPKPPCHDSFYPFLSPTPLSFITYLTPPNPLSLTFCLPQPFSLSLFLFLPFSLCRSIFLLHYSLRLSLQLDPTMTS